MVIFDDHELEISVVTYNRADYIKVLLEKNYFEARDRNITFIISDSSPNDKTRFVVESFNKKHDATVIYKHYDSNTTVGYKPILSILDSNSKYVWIFADSRFFDFEELDKKIFPHIKNNIEWISLFNNNFNFINEAVISDKTQMIHEFFVPITCVGCSIFKSSLFDFLKDQQEKKKIDSIFKNSYGFAYLGYFFTAFSKSERYKASFSIVKFYDIPNYLGVKKVQTWSKHFLECWIDELIHLINNIPNCYKNKEQLLEETWNTMKLDSFHYLYIIRKGDLNRQSFNKYKQAGIIRRISKHPLRIYLFANCPIFLLKCIVFCYYMLKSPYSLAKKILPKTLRHFCQKG